MKICLNIYEKYQNGMTIFDVRSDYINLTNQRIANYALSFLPDNYVGKARFYYFGLDFNVYNPIFLGRPNCFLILALPNSEISKKLDTLYEYKLKFKFADREDFDKNAPDNLVINDCRKYYLELDVKEENLLPGYYPDTIKLILGSEKYKDFLEKMTGKTQGIVNIKGKDYPYFYKNDVEEYFLKFC